MHRHQELLAHGTPMQHELRKFVRNINFGEAPVMGRKPLGLPASGKDWGGPVQGLHSQPADPSTLPLS
eukprot:1139902-Pelagomonas_calceolata.AAC.5